MFHTSNRPTTDFQERNYVNDFGEWKYLNICAFIMECCRSYFICAQDFFLISDSHLQLLSHLVSSKVFIVNEFMCAWW